MKGMPDDDILLARDIAARTARRYVDRDLAEDVAQETLIRLQGADPEHLVSWQAWVATTSRNLALDIVRREVRRREIDGRHRPRIATVGASDGATRADAVAIALSILGDRERKVFVAHLQGASNADIADDLGYASASSVGVTLSRSRAKMRRAFPDEDELRLLLGDVPRAYDVNGIDTGRISDE